MNIAHCSVGQGLLILGHGGNSDVGIVEVGVSLTVDVHPLGESGSIGIRNVCVLVEQSVSLGNLQGSGVQASIGDVTGHHILVGLGVVGAVVILPGQSVDTQDVGVVVGGIGLKDNGVALGVALHQEGTVVSNVVGGGAVLVVGGFLGSCELFNAECAALAQEVAAVHGSEDVVAQHGQEVGGRIAQGVLQGVVIQSLDTDITEVGGLAAQVLGSAHDGAVNQPFQTGGAVHHVLHTGNKVISGDFADFTALRVNPLHTLTDLEGEDGHVVVGLNALSDSGLLSVLDIVHHQAVVQLNQRTGVGLEIGVQSVPGLGVGGGGVLVLVVQGVAVLGQVSLGFGDVGSSIRSFHPHSLQGIAVGRLNHFLGDQQRVLAVGVIAPQSAVGSLGNSAADAVVTIVGSGGQQHASLEHLGLSQSFQCVALVYIHAFQGGHVHVIELAQDLVVQFLVILFFQSGDISISAEDHRKNHCQCQNDCEKFLHVCFLLKYFLQDFMHNPSSPPA